MTEGTETSIEKRVLKYMSPESEQSVGYISMHAYDHQQLLQSYQKRPHVGPLLFTTL